MKELVGKKIIGLHISDDQVLLKFETTSAIYIYKVDGDCCLESWFADIIGVENLLNANIISVDAIEMRGCCY